MNYMERRGSGFKKIKSDYRTAFNYRPEAEPKFYSDSSSFWVTLYNLNYNSSGEKVSPGNKKLAFEGKKLAFEGEKLAFEDENVAFEENVSSVLASRPTIEKTMRLFNEYGYDNPFSRADIINEFRIASSSAGYLLNKLQNVNIIESVSGHGKGKYHFIKK